MSFLTFWSNLGKRQRKIDDMSAQIYSELQQTNDPFAMDPLLADALAEHCRPTRAEVATIVMVCARLPLRQRLALEMSSSGYTAPEIARSLGITKEIAIKELAAALHEMEKEMPPESNA